MGRSYSRKQRREFTDANREAWDQAAPVHEKINQARLLEAFSKPGYNTLDQHSLDRLKEIGVQGKSISQLCCNNGRELLSLKNLGAGHCVDLMHQPRLSSRHVSSRRLRGTRMWNS